MAPGSSFFDVLVIGSGASGLAGSALGRAGGRPRRPRDEGVASSPATPRRRRVGSRPRSGPTTPRAPRQGRLAKLARDRRPPPRRGAHLRGDRRDPLARRSSASSSPAITAGIDWPAAAAPRGSGSCRSATAPATRSRRACARRSRRAAAPSFRTTRCARSSGRPPAGARPSSTTASLWWSRRERSVPPPAAAASGSPRSTSKLSTNRPGATGEVTELALALGAESRDLDALQYRPNGGAWPAACRATRFPRRRTPTEPCS